LTALLGSLGAAVQSSVDVQQANATLRDQFDAAFVHFQFGDRMSQMLSIVANDMTNFARWVAANPQATQSDAAGWLAALEASYTMDEQRSSHHGNVHVDLGSGVDFF
jgi:methyl-accepting chemotaxis protein